MARTETERLLLLSVVNRLSTAQGIYVRETGTDIFVGANEYSEVRFGDDPSWWGNDEVVSGYLEACAWPLRPSESKTEWVLRIINKLSSAYPVSVFDNGVNLTATSPGLDMVAFGGPESFVQTEDRILRNLKVQGWPLREALNHMDESIVTSGGPKWVTKTYVTKTYPAGTRFKPFATTWASRDVRIWETLVPLSLTVESHGACRNLEDGVEVILSLTEAIEPEAERRARLRRVVLNGIPCPDLVIHHFEPHFRDTYSPHTRELVAAMLLTGGVSETVELYEEVSRRVARALEQELRDAKRLEDTMIAEATDIQQGRIRVKRPVERSTGTPSWPSHDSGADWED